MNIYKPTLKVNIGNNFIGYFENRQQFNEVYSALAAEKSQVSSDAKVYLDSEPVFVESYVRNSLIENQNVYTNLRAEIRTEYTVYDVAVNSENKMRFNTVDEANKYAEGLKSEVANLNVEVKTEKVSELGEITSVEVANNILNDLVSRNKPVNLPQATQTVQEEKTENKSTVKATNTAKDTSKSDLANVSSSSDGIWPTKSRYISSPYGWRSGSFHTGTDIAGSAGDPIYAYKDGVVTFAGWNASGYGYLIKLDHGNGFSTWYAHSSKLLVSVGDKVTQGQVISLMGTTGYSTGNHLHFEVRINGSHVNSYNYIAGK